MAFVGTKREQKDFAQKVGVFEGDVVAVNPNKEQLTELLGGNVDIKKEPEYVTEKEDSDTGKQVKQLILSFWLKDVKTDGLFNLKFFIKDKIKTNKEGSKTQYINSQGASTWAKDKTSFQEWFLKAGKEGIREAREGEADFLEFVRSWLNQINFKEKFELTFDLKKLFNGNFSEVRDLMKADVRGTVLALATVKEVTDSTTGDKKNYQQVYNRAFLPGYTIKEFRTKPITAEFIEKAEQAKLDKKLKPVQRFVLTVSDSEYGVKDFYKLTELTDYVAEENVAAGESAINMEDAEY